MEELNIKYDSAYANFESLPSELRLRLRNHLTYIDRSIEYKKSKSIGYNLPSSEICLLEGQRFYTGLMPRVDWIINKNYSVNYSSDIKNIKATPIALPDWLYPHQIEMIDSALESYRTIIQSPTGSGKSIAIYYFVKHFPTAEILITVPNRGLLKQTVIGLEKVLDEKIGIVGDSKQDWRRVTVGIINTLSKIARETPRVFQNIDIYIADEVHSIGDNWYIPLCLAMTNNSYRLGFSATPKRHKGDSMVLEGLIGPVGLTVKEEYLINNKILVRPHYLYIEQSSPKINYKNYNYANRAYNTPTGLPDRHEVINTCIVNNVERNQLIINLIIAYLKTNPKLPALILVEMIDHGQILSNLLNSVGIDAPFVYGKSKRQERDMFIDNLKTCKLKVGIASKILNEGIDVPSLGLGIIAGGGGNDSKFIQQVGRFVRIHPDKEKAIIIDIHDDESYYLKKNSSTRLSVFKKKYNTPPIKVTKGKIIELINEQFSTI